MLKEICSLHSTQVYILQDLVSVSDKPEAETSATFLRSYEEHLIPALLLHQADEDLQALCKGIHGPDAGPLRLWVPEYKPLNYLLKVQFWRCKCSIPMHLSALGIIIQSCAWNTTGVHCRWSTCRGRTCQLELCV